MFFTDSDMFTGNTIVSFYKVSKLLPLFSCTCSWSMSEAVSHIQEAVDIQMWQQTCNRNQNRMWNFTKIRILETNLPFTNASHVQLWEVRFCRTMERISRGELTVTVSLCTLQHAPACSTSVPASPHYNAGLIRGSREVSTATYTAVYGSI